MIEWKTLSGSHYKEAINFIVLQIVFYFTIILFDVHIHKIQCTYGEQLQASSSKHTGKPVDNNILANLQISKLSSYSNLT